MIVSFRFASGRDIFHGHTTKAARKVPLSVHKIAVRKLDLLNAAHSLADLREPPGNRLESLRGEYEGKYSIRINRQFRIVFIFKDNNAYEVEILDYH